MPCPAMGARWVAGRGRFLLILFHVSISLAARGMAGRSRGAYGDILEPAGSVIVEPLTAGAKGIRLTSRNYGLANAELSSARVPDKPKIHVLALLLGILMKVPTDFVRGVPEG